MHTATATNMYLFDVIAVEQHSSLHRVIEPEQQPTNSLLMTLATVARSKDMRSASCEHANQTLSALPITTANNYNDN
jgi:hypothetical protein